MQPSHEQLKLVNLIPAKTAAVVLLFIVILVMSTSIWAQQNAQADSNNEDCSQANICIEQSNWQIGVALGLGAKSNPLVDGDAIPQVVLLDVAWYGENAYFDNGELGYKFIETEYTGLESYLTLDRERAFFNFWHPTNVFVTGSALNPSVPASDTDNQTPEISIEQVERREWAVNAGLRMHLYGDNDEWIFSAEQDISSVHNGYKAAFSYQYFWRGNDWSLMVRPSLIWKSDKLIDYYYGLSDQDRLIHTQGYTAKGGLQPAISLLYTKQINPNWQWIVSASYQKLHTSMKNSPLVRHDHISSLFIGAGYKF